MNGRIAAMRGPQPRAVSSAPKPVLVIPGCSTVAVTPVPSRRFASSYVNITLASFDWLYASCPEYFRSPIRSSKSILPMDWAPDDTVTIRAGALSLNRSSRRLVSRNGAR
jgi:hypothetical protein